MTNITNEMIENVEALFEEKDNVLKRLLQSVEIRDVEISKLKAELTLKCNGGEPVAWLVEDSINERYLCFSKPKSHSIPLYAKQPISEDTELLEAMKNGYVLHYTPPHEEYSNEWNTNNVWWVERWKAPFMGASKLRIWSGKTIYEALDKASKDILTNNI